MPLLNLFRCDGPEHDDSCPKWCALRPGGATKPVPIVAKATSLTDPSYYRDRTTDRDGDAPTGQQQ